jgi:hypothetical protein
MFKTRCSILHWIYFWEIRAVLSNTVGHGTDWGLLVSSITAFFVVAGTFYGIGRWYFRKRHLNNPAEVYYEISTDNIQNTYTTNESAEIQHLVITIKMKCETNVERIRLQFKGEGRGIPQILKFYNPYREDKKVSDNIESYEAENANWHWDYRDPLHRLKGSRIQLGIEYIAKDTFKGLLEIGITCSETAKVLRLPFAVIKEP